MQLEIEGIKARMKDARTRAAETSRVSTTRQVRDFRDRLSSISGLPLNDDSALLQKYATGRVQASSTVLVLAFLIQAFSLLVTDVMTVALNIALVVLGNLFATMHARAIIRSGDLAVVSRAHRRAVLLELFYGMTWLPALLPFMFEGTIGSTVMLFVALAVLAVASIVGAPLPFTTLAAAGPTLLLLIARFGAEITLESGIFLALTLTGVVFFVVLAIRLYKDSLAQVRARIEKDLLIAELEEAKVNSDEARRRAESANVAKSQFLAQMSHELRTPLNAILGFSEVLSNELFGPLKVPQYKEYAADIHTSGEHLLKLINEILDISRIEAGRTELHEEPIMLAFIMEDCQHLLRVRAKTKGVTIREHYEPNLSRLWADERAIRQIVLNLMSNAIKFTPSGGEIVLSIGWTPQGGQFISVRDNGPGIPEDEIPQVLSNFGQGTNAIKVAEQGTGLGLPIVKGLVDLHGGTFTLSSRLREGTEVRATFPPERVMQALEAVKAPPTQPEKPHHATDFLAQSAGFNRELLEPAPQDGRFNVRRFLPRG